MSDYESDYGHDRKRSSAYLEALAAVHEAQGQRITMVALGDAYLGIARCLVKLDRKNTPQACGRAIQAVELYQRAGLTRAGRAAWRWARFAHRAQWREAVADEPTPPRAARPGTARQLELVAAVDRITRERGRPPSWRELAEALGIGLRTVRELADRCREKGLVRFTIGKPRTITTTWAGRERRP